MYIYIRGYSREFCNRGENRRNKEKQGTIRALGHQFFMRVFFVYFDVIDPVGALPTDMLNSI